MELALSRRLVALPAFLLGIALWSGVTLAASESFQVQLSGAQQSPAVQTTGTGTADLTYDPATREVTWSITYSGLSGAVTMAHFHGPAAEGKNAKVQVWLAQQGSPVENPVTGKVKLTTAQAKEFMDGQWYINLHTMAHPGGEIRGQVTPPKS